jgi:hypothetical protein
VRALIIAYSSNDDPRDPWLAGLEQLNNDAMVRASFSKCQAFSTLQHWLD